MIYHQFVTIWTSLLWFPTHFSNMVHTLELSFKQMCIQILLHYLGYNMTYGICDNLFTKHSTHMTYISKPLVRKFRTL